MRCLYPLVWEFEERLKQNVKPLNQSGGSSPDVPQLLPISICEAFTPGVQGRNAAKQDAASPEAEEAMEE